MTGPSARLYVVGERVRISSIEAHQRFFRTNVESPWADELGVVVDPAYAPWLCRIRLDSGETLIIDKQLFSTVER